jgi:hypothetical protein
MRDIFLVYAKPYGPAGDRESWRQQALCETLKEARETRLALRRMSNGNGPTFVGVKIVKAQEVE